MLQDTTAILRVVKYSAILLGTLMVVGIAALMVIARGKDEDITGIVAPASLVTIVSVLVAIAATLLQRRA